MKILCISNLFPPYYLGGYEILCAQVCNELEQRGHEIIVLTSTHGLDGRKEGGEISNVHRILKVYIPFDQPPRLMRMRRWRVGKYNYGLTSDLIAGEHPDVIFIWSQLRLTLGSARAAQDSGIPVACTFNDEHIAGFLPAPFRLTPRHFAGYVADHWIFPDITFRGMQFKHATCISHMLKNNLLSRGMPISDAKVIYQGIPLEQFPEKPEAGKVKTPAHVLYVGQLHPYKGVHTLIEAANMIADCGVKDLRSPARNVSVSIIGDGPEGYKSKLKEKAAQGNAIFEFVGKVPHSELPRIYREHDIFVFPSTWQEPFGLTPLEAMASGTPVISTADGGHGEILRDGENALVFEKENSEQLAGQIIRLITDRDLGQHLAANARAMVENDFTLKRYVSDLEAFLWVAKENGTT